MRMRFWHPGCLAIAFVSVWSPTAQAQKPALADVLKTAADYLVQYAQKLATVAAEEEYTQRDTTSGITTRRLHSDIVLVGLDDGLITAFRDVFSIDTRPVRQRDGRLLTLFQGPPSETVQTQAAAMADEGVKYYISPNLRPFDIPTLPLDILLQKNQEQSEFTLDSVKAMDGAEVAILKFKARNTARVLPTPEGSTTTGRFWVDIATGTIRQTEMTVSSRNFNFIVTAKYAADPTLGLWVPVSVVQQSEMSYTGSGAFSNMGAGGGMGSRQSLEGRATYSKFRRVLPKA